MADDNLNTPVVIQASRIDSTLLPPGFSLPYQLYVIQQGSDFGLVANKANEAGGGAYDAQVKNEEQDVTLASHETRITQNTNDISNLTIRVISVESTIVSLQNDVATLTTRVTTAEGTITTLQASVSSIQSDYVSKSAAALQTIGSPISVATSYSVGGTKVIGTRQTGWTASTGTALLGAFNSSQAYTVSATYTQAEITAIANGLIQARQRIKALEDMARTHGLMN